MRIPLAAGGPGLLGSDGGTRGRDARESPVGTELRVLVPDGPSLAFDSARICADAKHRTKRLSGPWSRVPPHPRREDQRALSGQEAGGEPREGAARRGGRA